MASKPPGIRVLEQRGIPHEVVRFDSSIRSAMDVAVASGVPPAEVYKTLVVQSAAPGSKPLLVVAPAERTVDLKALARATGAKRLRMATQREAERLTGLRVGGISPLALLEKRWTVFLDAAALDRETILVSGGARGWDVRLRVDHLVDITGAVLYEAGDAEEV